MIGPGACRGPDWSDDEWPLAVGDRTLEDCSEKCQDTEDCTAFSLGKGKKPKKPCMLYSHEDIQAASSLGGECYKIVTGMFSKIRILYISVMTIMEFLRGAGKNQ